MGRSECESVTECLHCESASLTCLYSRPVQCDQHLVLDEASRSVTSGQLNDRDSVGTSYKSPDWQGPTWYKLANRAGKFIPEKSPGADHCGTWGSGYLTEPHPTRLYETIQLELRLPSVEMKILFTSSMK